MDEEDKVWAIAATLASLGAAKLTKNILSRSWEKRRGSVPGNPATDDTTWNEALMWAVVSGVAVGVARLLSQRGVAYAFEKGRGGLPAKAHDTAA
ncbi:MAG: DUF4235 domain-containing protein [Aquihabitans sp.]